MRSSKLTNRPERVFLIYKYLLLNYDINDLTMELKNNNKFTISEEEAIIEIIKNIDETISKAKKWLNTTWTWDRVNKLEQAVIINGISEMTLFFNNKKIVINESVEFAKKYCEINAKSLINGILDKI